MANSTRSLWKTISDELGLLFQICQPLQYRAKQISAPRPKRRQGFGGPTTQIMVFRAIELKPLSSIQLICNCKVFSIYIYKIFLFIFVSSLIISLISLVVVAISKSIRIKKLFKKIVVVAFNTFSLSTMSKVTKLKLNIKRKLTINLFNLAKKFISVTILD